MNCPIVQSLRWSGAFGADNNIYERAAKNIEDLSSCLEDLAMSADTAELLLKRECPGEAASLGARVTAAINLLTTLRCQTCKGFGRIEELGDGSHVCKNCAPVVYGALADLTKDRTRRGA